MRYIVRQAYGNGNNPVADQPVMKLMDQFQPMLVHSPRIATWTHLLAKSSLRCIG